MSQMSQKSQMSQMSQMSQTCLLITLIKCLKDHKSLGSLCSVVKTLIVSGAGPTDGRTMSPIELFWTANQGHLDNNENLVWVKWGIFMSEGEDWEVFGKLRNMGRIRSETFHICRPAKVCKKTFSTMQKLFDQLENLYLRKVSILFASAYYISVLSLTGIWIQ